MPRNPSADNARPDARELVSAELLGQVKVRRELLRRAILRYVREAQAAEASPERGELLALFESYDQSVGALVDLLSLDAPSAAIETRPRGA